MPGTGVLRAEGGVLSIGPGEKVCWTADLGTIPVPEAEETMSQAAERRANGLIPDTVFFLAHPPTVALGLKDGRSEPPKDLLVSPEELKTRNIALTRSIRGGGITYHWPGQVVCYPVVALATNDRDIRGYMTRLEEVGILTLRRFGLEAHRRRDASAYVGLWIGNKKIVSMGVRVNRWVTSFGFALNLEGEHAPSSWIRPCGLEGVDLVTVEDRLGYAPSRESIVEAVSASFAEVFSCTISSGHHFPASWDKLLMGSGRSACQRSNSFR